jgi:hypothetical protein
MQHKNRTEIPHHIFHNLKILSLKIKYTLFYIKRPQNMGGFKLNILKCRGGEIFRQRRTRLRR